MKSKHIVPTVLWSVALSLGSCLKSEVDDYDDWRTENDQYLTQINTREYEKISPVWAPQNCCYIKWHNDRTLTADSLVPMSNSTVQVKYHLEDINGLPLDSSYNAAAGDSLYTFQPDGTVIGFWIALTTMHVGDSATVIIPYNSGYGTQINGNVKPYSNLIYRLKIQNIKAFEKPDS